jgi:hypothetical protein
MSDYKLFLETTIQIERIFGRTSKDISEFLRDKEALTSNYVLMEFKRTILKDCIVLYSFLKEEKGLEDAFRRISELKDYEHRTASRISLILSKLSENNTLEYEKVLNKLEDLIESELLEYFFYRVKLIDETKCGLANEEVHRNETYSLNLRCRRDEKKCEIEEFVERKREEFKKLLNDLQTHKEFESSCKVIKEILEDCEKARGRKNCWKVGDFIISIEAPKNYKIFTTDHHYEQICNSLDRDVLLPRNLTHTTTYRL